MKQAISADGTRRVRHLMAVVTVITATTFVGMVLVAVAVVGVIMLLGHQADELTRRMRPVPAKVTPYLPGAFDVQFPKATLYDELYVTRAPQDLGGKAELRVRVPLADLPAFTGSLTHFRKLTPEEAARTMPPVTDAQSPQPPTAVYEMRQKGAVESVVIGQLTDPVVIKLERDGDLDMFYGVFQ